MLWIFIDCWLDGGSADKLVGWGTALLGLLGSRGLLEEVFGFLALSERGFNHGVSHARRSEMPADYVRFVNM